VSIVISKRVWAKRRLLAAGIRVSLLLLCPAISRADSVAPKSSDNSVEAELASFEVRDGYELGLYASETDGIANPVAMRWDAKGRLWVLTTLAYAQLEPGKLPSDQLLVLEDTDRDGEVDKSTVWADNLNMPTGFALSGDGVYLSEGRSLLRLRDTNGDGKADTRETILSGFGVGDTHQNINSLTWGPAGDLWFSQGLHNYSRVETPWGIVRGESAGFYRLRLRDLKLEPFCMPAMASENPWGISFGPWGGVFVKSNAKELAYVTPGVIPTDHYLQLTRLSTVAVTPGKSMGCEFVETAHLPELEDHALIAGYYSNRVTAYPLKEDGSGFAQTQGIELLVSSHPSFRPVEVLVGPDGAIYVADWFNPIIGHYQASLRHPDRDREHGRIWRITAKGGEALDPIDLTDSSVEELIHHLASSERWIRTHAKRRLAETHTVSVREALGETEGVDDHHRFELAGVYESHDLVDNALVERCLEGADPRLRAYGARMIGRWHEKLDAPLSLIERSIADGSPRVRLEAVVSASHFDNPDAMRLALRALDAEVDKLISYALTQCVHAMAEHWLPALKSGRMSFDSTRHLIFALGAYGGSDTAEIMSDLVASASGEERRSLLLLLAELGDGAALKLALESVPIDVELLQTLRGSWLARGVRPEGEVASRLDGAFRSGDPELLSLAIELAGYWNVEALLERIMDMATDEDVAESVRSHALVAIARIQNRGALPLLSEIGKSDSSREARKAAARAMSEVDLQRAASLSSALLTESSSVEEAMDLLSPYLSRRGGTGYLAKAFADRALSSEVAALVSQALSQAGRDDEELVEMVNGAIGVQSQIINYSADFVEKLVAEIRESGIAENGKRVYESPLGSCVACHAIKGEGGAIGPDLTTVGAGLPLELIVESVLWPSRQLKEGYISTSVTTRDGRIYSGYREREEGGVLWLRDIATQEVVPIPVNDIQERNEIGTLMPSGLTANLSREELRDLMRYLWELRG